MITADNLPPTNAELAAAQERLRAFICGRLQGKCKLLSLGHGCQCALCDFDRMRAAVAGESEACAKECERIAQQYANAPGSHALERAANAIRLRSNSVIGDSLTNSATR